MPMIDIVFSIVHISQLYFTKYQISFQQAIIIQLTDVRFTASMDSIKVNKDAYSQKEHFSKWIFRSL